VLVARVDLSRVERGRRDGTRHCPHIHEIATPANRPCGGNTEREHIQEEGNDVSLELDRRICHGVGFGGGELIAHEIAHVDRSAIVERPQRVHLNVANPFSLPGLNESQGLCPAARDLGGRTRAQSARENEEEKKRQGFPYHGEGNRLERRSSVRTRRGVLSGNYGDQIIPGFMSSTRKEGLNRTTVLHEIASIPSDGESRDHRFYGRGISRLSNRSNCNAPSGRPGSDYVFLAAG